jgi:hypothetical protein
MTIINLGDYKKRDIARLIGMSVDEMNAELQTDQGMEWVFGRIVQAFEARYGAAEEAAANELARLHQYAVAVFRTAVVAEIGARGTCHPGRDPCDSNHQLVHSISDLIA